MVSKLIAFGAIAAAGFAFNVDASTAEARCRGRGTQVVVNSGGGFGQQVIVNNRRGLFGRNRSNVVVNSGFGNSVFVDRGFDTAFVSSGLTIVEQPPLIIQQSPAILLNNGVKIRSGCTGLFCR